MRIAFDFDDTLVNTKEKVREFLDRYGIDRFHSSEEKEEFYRQHIEEIMLDITLKDDVLKSLQILVKDHELYIITARSNYYSPRLKQMTLEFIKQQQLPIREVYFDCLGFGKRDQCMDLGIDLFIDDDIDNCLCVKSAGIDVLLYDNHYEGIHTVSSFKEIVNYVKEGMHGGRESRNE